MIRAMLIQGQWRLCHVTAEGRIVVCGRLTNYYAN